MENKNVKTIECYTYINQVLHPVFICVNPDGSTWYCQKGGFCCALTYDDVHDGMNINKLNDDTFFYTDDPITNEKDFIDAIQKESEI